MKRTDDDVELHYLTLQSSLALLQQTMHICFKVETIITLLRHFIFSDNTFHQGLV